MSLCNRLSPQSLCQTLTPSCTTPGSRVALYLEMPPMSLLYHSIFYYSSLMTEKEMTLVGRDGDGKV